MSERDAEIHLKVDNTQYTQGIKESTTATEKFNAALTKTSDTASKIVKTTGKGLLKIGAAEVAGLTALSAVAATLEKQTSNIQANLALNKTSSQYNAVTGSIRQMSREMPMARAEIAAMATSVSNLGMVTAKQIGGVSETFGKMGIATGESGIGLAQSMVQFQRSMGMTQPTNETMTPYANAVTGLSAKSGTNAADILGFAQSFAPAARVSGLSQASVLGISTAANRAGAEGQYAASTISQILNDITQLRYTNSPELGRYSRALGMESGELSRKTTGPEDQDRFMRDIISRVVGVAQTEEGPSRLSMMGLEGLRARRALQGLAAEPGGVDKYIQQAEFGMNQPNVQRGFEAAAGGLEDQMVTLRNRATDVGQAVGEPMMHALTGFTKALNAAAGVIQPFTDLVTTVVGKFGGLVGTLTMIGGGLLLAWNLISKATLAGRMGWSTGVKSFVGGAQDAQMLARGGTGAFSQAGARMVNPNEQTSAVMRGAYRVGGAFSTLAPGVDTRASIGQNFLRGLDRTIQFFGRGVQDFYAKAQERDPFKRLDTRLADARQLDAYKASEAARLAQREAAVKLGQQAGLTRAEADKMVKPFVPAPMPVSNITGVPLGYSRAGEDLTTKQVLKEGFKQLLAAPKAAGATGVVAAGQAVKALGGAVIDRAIVQPWQNMRMGQQMVGGVLPWTGAALQAAPGAAMSGLGKVAGGIGAVASSGMAQSMAIMAAITALMDARGKYNEWAGKFKEEGGGYAETELDNLNEYNEKLGIATRSLTQFSKGLDEANPARGEDINQELSNVANVRDYGRGMDELVNARLSTVETVEQAKEWISSQGPMNADQWVLVMRDFSRVFRDNQSAFNELNNWVKDNQKNGAVPIENVGTPELAESFVDEAVGGGSGWQKWLRFIPFSGTSAAVSAVTGGDPTGIRSSEKFQQTAQMLIGSQLSQAKTIGETKDATAIFGRGGRRPTVDQQTALTRAEGMSMFVSTVIKMMEDIEKVKFNPTEAHERRIALDQYLKSASEFGLSGMDLDAKMEKGDFLKNIQGQITGGAKNDEALQTIIGAGLVPKILSGETVSTGLKDLTVRTSAQQAVAGTSFEQISPKTFDKYFGAGSLIGRGLLAAGNLSDPSDFDKAAGDLADLVREIDRMKSTPTTSMGLTIQGTQTGDSLGRQYAIAEEMKINNPEGTQGFALAEEVQRRQKVEMALEDVGNTSLEQVQVERGRMQALFKLKSATASERPVDFAEQLQAGRGLAETKRQTFEDTTNQWGITRAREEYDWQRNSAHAWEDYYRSREQGNADFNRSMARSQAAYNRQFANSEAAFRRSLKYQSQDFYRGREREAEAHARQMAYTAEDMAKSIGDPYNRLQLQMLNDPMSAIITRENRLQVATKQNENLDTLRGRGLTQESINQLDLSNFANAQQTQHFVNTMTPEQVAEINRQTIELVAQGGALSKQETGTQRGESERDIALVQGLEDFLRNLKRTKFEHEVQVKFSAKEFKISIGNAIEDHEIALDRAEAAMSRTMERAAAQRQRMLTRQLEDLFGFADKGIDVTWATTNKIIGKGGVMEAFGGRYKTALTDLGENLEAAVLEINAVFDWMAEETAKAKAKASRAAVNAGINDPSRGAPSGNTGSHQGSSRNESLSDTQKAAYKGWDKHPSYHTGSGELRVWSDKTKKYVDVETWQKQWPGWQDPKYSFAAGGIIGPKQGGHHVTVAEGGSAEMILPLNSRGINFMSQFTKGVAREMFAAMPKTPVSAGSTSSNYDHSQHINIATVDVSNSDPRFFVKELQKEASKKRAALYKS